MLVSARAGTATGVNGAKTADLLGEALPDVDALAEWEGDERVREKPGVGDWGIESIMPSLTVSCCPYRT